MIMRHEGEEGKNEKRNEQKEQRALRARLVPIWLRLFIVLFLLFASVMVGLVLGYSVVGDGEGFRILRLETWQDLYQYISGGS